MHVLATLHHDGTHTEFYQPQRSKESGRTLTHHNGMGLVRHIGIMCGDIGFVFGHLVDVHPHLEIDVDGTLTGIDGPFEHTHMAHRTGINALLVCQIADDGLF